MRCDHCGLEFEEEHFIKERSDDRELHFCCKGCQGVWHLLSGAKLDKFYDIKGAQTLTPPTHKQTNFARFDTDAFTKSYVKNRDGLNEISLVLEGIHCAACVWLNEKVLHTLDGVYEANINFTTHKAKILFDINIVPVSKIIEAIESIGYTASAYNPAVAEEQANKERKEYYTRLIVAVFASMNVMWLAIARYLGYFSTMDSDLVFVIHLAEFLLATPTLFYSGWVFFRGGFYGLKNGFVTMDLLVSTGATLTWSYSIYALFVAHHEAYFDSVTMIITFVLIGKFLEVKAKKSAVDTLDSLISLAPTECTKIVGGVRQKVALEEVAEGDIIEISAGERIVFDSIITKGTVALDEASLTGESVPRVATVGDKVLGGAICTDGVLELKVLKDYESSTFKSIINLLEDSLSKKPEIENLANSLSRYFSSTILTIAVITFVAWFWAVGADFDRALMVAVSVIVVACPCALALATPIATVIGTSFAAKNQILFRATKYLESLAKAKSVLLDKTGTLTIGKPQVVAYKEFAPYDKGELLGLIGASLHPVSMGVKEYIAKQNAKKDISDIKVIAGRGIASGDMIGGNYELIRESGIDAPNLGGGFYFAQNGELKAHFELQDSIKDDAKDAIDTIKMMDLEIVILTGDDKKIADQVANILGISAVYANLLPEEKAKIVEKYQQKGAVVMVGDGINDAVALAKADVAIALHSGTDVAIASSSVVLLKSTVKDLANSMLISRKTYKTIKENIGFSFVYNAFMIPIAVLGFVSPLIAALAMSASSLVVVGNSFRIKNVKLR